MEWAKVFESVTAWIIISVFGLIGLAMTAYWKYITKKIEQSAEKANEALNKIKLIQEHSPASCPVTSIAEGNRKEIQEIKMSLETFDFISEQLGKLSDGMQAYQRENKEQMKNISGDIKHLKNEGRMHWVGLQALSNVIGKHNGNAKDIEEETRKVQRDYNKMLESLGEKPIEYRS